MKRRITAMLIVLVMLLGMMPGTVSADATINDISWIEGLVDGKAVLGSTLSFKKEKMEYCLMYESDEFFAHISDGDDYSIHTMDVPPESPSFYNELSGVDGTVKWDVPDIYWCAGMMFQFIIAFENGDEYRTISIPTVTKMSKIPIDPLPSKTYTGSPHKPDCSKIVHGEVEFREGVDYTVSYKNNTNVGTASVIFTGKGRVVGSVTKTFQINKMSNTMTAQGKTVKIKAAKLKKKKQIIKTNNSLRICNAVGNLKFKLAGVNKKKFKKYFKVNARNGNITVKKGLKKGKYKLKIDITAAGNANYLAATKSITVTVRVK